MQIEFIEPALIELDDAIEYYPSLFQRGRWKTLPEIKLQNRTPEYWIDRI